MSRLRKKEKGKKRTKKGRRKITDYQLPITNYDNFYFFTDVAWHRGMALA
ncbi:hypothetical protein BGP_5040 [Beggiatoa sp. PS]|nr:hypothetical protein BGP_5040 [Beggiatoa sp. PS]